MKKTILLVVPLLAGLVTLHGVAARKPNSVSVKFKNVSLAFVQQPFAADSKLLPLIDGVTMSGNKERFGVYWGSSLGTTPAIEILDMKSNVVQTLSVNDLLGKGASMEERLLPNAGSGKPRRAENVYSVRIQQHEAQIIVKAIATGDEAGGDQQLVVTFAVKSGVSMNIALRAKLPILGNAEALEGGVFITSKSGNAGIAAVIFPQTEIINVEKSRIVITSATRTTEAAEETALLWLVIRGVSSSSSTDAKTQAQRVINDNGSKNNEPRLVVVNAADKEKLAQSDTASYSLVCTNIGTGEATNVVLANPVPKGARYIEGSATSGGMVLNIEKSGEVQTDGTRSLKWTLPQPLKPGEEKIVSFKVVVQ